MLSDLTAVAAAAALALLGINALIGPQSFDGTVPYLLLFALLPCAFLLLGLYPSAGIGPVEELRRLIISLSVFTAFMLPFLLTQVSTPIAGFLMAALFWGSSILMAPSGRALLRLAFARRAWWGKPVVVLGAGKTAELLITRLASNPGLDLKVVGCLDDDGSKVGTPVAGVTVAGDLDSADQFKKQYGVDYAIVAMPGVSSQRTAVLVQRLSTVFSDVVVIPNAIGMTSVGTSTRDAGGLVGIHVYGHLSNPRDRRLKRLADILMLFPAAIVALPVVCIAALAVMIASPGKPFFRQQREGRLGRPIYIWKLRTMRQDSDAVLQDLLATSETARTEWEQHFKLTHDPRIIPVVGRFLRRTSIDELPQLVNVLKGEMSFVGPRPFPYYHLDQFGPDFRTLRSSVPPGITGYWQVTSRSTADLTAQVELDSYYIKNWSPWMDLYILARTPWAVLFGAGAY